MLKYSFIFVFIECWNSIFIDFVFIMFLLWMRNETKKQYLFADGSTRFIGYRIFGGNYGNQWTSILYNCHLLCSHVFFIGQRDSTCGNAGIKRRDDCGQENGIARIHKFRMLGTNRFFWTNCISRSSIDRCGQIQNFTGFLLSTQFMRRSLFICNTYSTISTWFICLTLQVNICLYIHFTEFDNIIQFVLMKLDWMNIYFKCVCVFCRYGLFQKTAQQYKMNYSMPTTHQTCPIPLLDRRRSSQPDPSAAKKLKEETHRKEEFVWY